MEPLKDFHKDEVRGLGKNLGLPPTIVQRHPFPGKSLLPPPISCLLSPLLSISMSQFYCVCPSLFLVYLPCIMNPIFDLLGPGLAIRVLCADEPFICNDFAETNTKLGFIVDYSNAMKKVWCDFVTRFARFVVVKKMHSETGSRSFTCQGSLIFKSYGPYVRALNAPPYLCDLFIRHSKSSSYALRSTETDLKLPMKKSCIRQRFFRTDEPK